VTEEMRTYQAGNLGDKAIVQQGEHLSLVINNISTATPAFSYRGIAGIPPLTDKSAIQQRTQLVEAIYTKLTQPAINALALTGIGGMGKSTLAALLTQYVQAQPSTGNGFFQDAPLWLHIDQVATFADVIGTLFQRLDKPMSILDNLSPAGQVEALFALLDTLESPRLIVLDQFDNLLDWATGKTLSTQVGVSEWIDAFKSRSWKSNTRLLLTSRPFPQGTQGHLSPCFQEYAVGALIPLEGLALLHLRGIQAAEADLQTAVTFCGGHPLSLVLLIALIQLYKIPLADLLAEPTLWLGDIATNLLDAVFQRLTEEQRLALCAMSVYRTAVPVTALVPFFTSLSSQQILQSLRPLLVQQVIQPAENGHYRLHAVVARYAQTHFVDGDQQANQQELWAAHTIAAHYYIQQASIISPEQRRGVNDIQGIIEAVWQYTQATQWQEAYELVEQEELFYNLSLWGGNILLLDLCQWFLPQIAWQPEQNQKFMIYLYLGRAHSSLGTMTQALQCYQQALNISKEMGNRNMEAATLNNIGLVYQATGQPQQALHQYQEALPITREIGNRNTEAATLNNIGLVYQATGQPQQALQQYQEALPILLEVGNRNMEATTLNNIGYVYHATGQLQQALHQYQEALLITREVGDRNTEAGVLNNIGEVYRMTGQPQQALQQFQEALPILREVGNRAGESTTCSNIAVLLYMHFNRQQEAIASMERAIVVLVEAGLAQDGAGQKIEDLRIGLQILQSGAPL
jgi:tetratricopeptide (TPR) repeat protein